MDNIRIYTYIDIDTLLIYVYISYITLFCLCGVESVCR